MRKAIGFYWTFPVKWLPIAKLDTGDIEAAVKGSKTIAVQREAIRRWARENAFKLIHEEAFVEAEPDRISSDTGQALDRLLERAKQADAKLLFVDLKHEVKVRNHRVLNELVDFQSQTAGCLQPVPLAWEEQQFLAEHFADWGSKHRRWLEKREERQRRTFARASQLQEQGHSLATVAQQLNERKLRSMTGKLWTEESLRKFLKKYS